MISSAGRTRQPTAEGAAVGVKVRQWKGAWWVFVDHKRQRKAKRIGVGAAGKRAAEDVAKAYEVQLSLSG